LRSNSTVLGGEGHYTLSILGKWKKNFVRDIVRKELLFSSIKYTRKVIVTCIFNFVDSKKNDTLW
jgi:hypothetical protein